MIFQIDNKRLCVWYCFIYYFPFLYHDNNNHKTKTGATNLIKTKKNQDNDREGVSENVAGDPGYTGLNGTT